MRTPTMKDLGLDELDSKNKALYLMWESSQSRSERTNGRLWIICIILIIALIGSNLGWLHYESQFEDVVTTTQTVTQSTEDGGNNTFTGDFKVGE